MPSGDNGLVGHLGGLTFEPEIEIGFFPDGGNLYPKQINLSGEFTVIHEHQVGWYKAGNAYTFGPDGGVKFPYGSSLGTTAIPPMNNAEVTTIKPKNANAKTKQVTQSINKGGK